GGEGARRHGKRRSSGARNCLQGAATPAPTRRSPAARLRGFTQSCIPSVGESQLNATKPRLHSVFTEYGCSAGLLYRFNGRGNLRTAASSNQAMVALSPASPRRWASKEAGRYDEIDPVLTQSLSNSGGRS